MSLALVGRGRVLYRWRRLDAGAYPDFVAPTDQAIRHRARAGRLVRVAIPAEEREADGRWLLHWTAKLGPFAVAAAMVLALFVGLRYGSYAAAGSDSYGYVSQARLWLAGTLRVEQPFVEQLPWANRDWMFTPLGTGQRRRTVRLCRPIPRASRS